MLAKDPAKRYQQPIDVAKALAPIIKAAVQPPKEKPPVPVAKVEPAPAKTARPPVVSPSIFDKPTVPPMRRDASVPVARRESETETVVRPPPKTTGPAPSGRSFSGAWLMGVAGAIGIVFLAAVGGPVYSFPAQPHPHRLCFCGIRRNFHPRTISFLYQSRRGPWHRSMQPRRSSSRKPG